MLNVEGDLGGVLNIQPLIIGVQYDLYTLFFTYYLLLIVHVGYLEINDIKITRLK